MITSIQMDTRYSGYEILEGKDNNLDNLDRINIFVGQNNSGKSRFMRSLLTSDLSIQVKGLETMRLASLVVKLKKELVEFLAPYERNNDINRLKQRIENIPDVSYVNSTTRFIDVKNQVNDLAIIETNMVNDGSGLNPQLIYKAVREKISNYKDKVIEYSSGYNEQLLKFSKVYIPILRGLRPLQVSRDDKSAFSFDSSVDNYSARSLHDYNIKPGQGISLHSGLDMYKGVMELLLGDHEDRLKVKDFEDYLSSTFFSGAAIHIVPRIGKDVLYIKIGDDKQFPIYDLGEGIQSIILLTYPLFFNRDKKVLFFIEEPELHLHPGLERIFIETLRNPIFKTFQYFITSHSNHILDLSLEYDDLSIYSFHKRAATDTQVFYIENVNSNHKQLLDILGVRNSSVFLSNCTIWVEGITDRLYLRKYLEILQKEQSAIFKEDFHYSFIEYAGNNITHWSFLEKDDQEFPDINIEGICSKIFLIVDNDGTDLPSNRGKEKKKERQQRLKNKLGENVYVTKGLEIENLLSKETLKRTIRSIEGKNEQLDFNEFDKEDHSSIYIGDFIENHVKGLKKTYASNYGTIHDKVNFCKKAVQQMTSIKDLSQEAVTLTKRLLTFIATSQ